MLGDLNGKATDEQWRRWRGVRNSRGLERAPSEARKPSPKCAQHVGPASGGREAPFVHQAGHSPDHAGPRPDDMREHPADQGHPGHTG